MRKKIFAFIAGILMMVGAAVPMAAFAGKCKSVQFFGLDPWYATLECDADGNVSEENFKTEEDSETGQSKLVGTVIGIIGVVVKDLLFFAGIGAILLVIYGGFLFITSQGNPGAVEKAKKTITNALIGLGIAILAYAIATFVLKTIVGA